jgi:beta-aspartyl-peptidase (threonine type)
MTNPIAIIVHGGAKEIPPEKAEANRAGCRLAAEAGWAVLEAGGHATDAVVAAVRVLEADPTFNAGVGATPNPDGVVRLDAGMMEGHGLNAGAIACVEGVRHPITVARRLLERPEVLLVAHHARSYAADACPSELCENDDLKPESAQREGKDTVGAVALDLHGLVAAGTSTGGLGTSLLGRVGDSPQVGAGFYADNAQGGSSCTGEGESILRMAMARTVLGRLEMTQDPDKAIQHELDRLAKRTSGAAGVIVLTPDGQVGWGHNEPNMAVAYRTASMDAPVAFTHKDEEQDRVP